jgi:hypothetical protein
MKFAVGVTVFEGSPKSHFPRIVNMNVTDARNLEVRHNSISHDAVRMCDIALHVIGLKSSPVKDVCMHVRTG